MCMENKALELVEQVDELKASNKNLKSTVETLISSGINSSMSAGGLFLLRRDIDFAKEAIKLSPTQCLKQHNIDFMNQIEKEYADGADIDFCDFFACYRVNLELDDG